MGNNEKTKTRILIDVALIAVLVVMFVFCILLAFYKFTSIDTEVSGTSMYPTLHNGDRILATTIDKYSYDDIVILKEKDMLTSEDRYIIKRVIARENDFVDMRYESGYLRVYRNGILLERKYLQSSYFETEPYQCKNFASLKSSGIYEVGEYGIKVPQGRIFVLGDNAITSNDSALYGPYDTKDVVAKFKGVMSHDANSFFEFLKYLF